MHRATPASLIGALFVTAGAAGAGGALPDLVQASVAVSKREVAAGARLRITDTVANGGHSASARSSTAYLLSRDRVRDRRDRLLARRVVSGMAPAGASKGSKAMRIPASTPRGAYRIVVCADGLRAVRESDEGNNCRATRAFTVIPLDATPPTFAGLQAATTCIPGPIGGDRKSVYRLRWSAAADDVTPQRDIVYDVYQATAPGRQSFSTPTYTTAGGATAFDTPQLPSIETYYFVVRARDEAGNRDSNRVERAGMNLCL
jgi:CARDB